jgi:uncharacterized membrane protein
MEPIFLLDVVSRITHVLTAILLVGGSMFSLWVLQPVAGKLDEDVRQELLHRVLSRWKWFVHLGIALFLLSGFYNYWRALPQHPGDSLYHALLGTKMLLALGVFFIAAALVGRSEALQAMRDRRLLWTRILVSIAFVIVAISGYLRIRGPKPEPKTPSAPVASQQR